jgi:hypothetical protein
MGKSDVQSLLVCLMACECSKGDWPTAFDDNETRIDEMNIDCKPKESVPET